MKPTGPERYPEPAAGGISPGSGASSGASADAGVEVPGPLPLRRPGYRWYHRVSAVLFITICLEVGFFLVIFPWTEFWENNYFASMIPHWRQYWDSMYVRGGISGLGVVNLYISFIEIFRLRRFAGR